MIVYGLRDKTTKVQVGLRFTPVEPGTANTPSYFAMSYNPYDTQEVDVIPFICKDKNVMERLVASDNVDIIKTSYFLPNHGAVNANNLEVYEIKV